MDAHLDTHYNDYERAWPCIAQVQAVKARDHANNPTGAFTVYDVTAHFQWPPANHDFADVPAPGQMAGGLIDIEVSYVVGQYVILAFMEGDPNRPYIDKSWPYHTTEVASVEGDGPLVRLLVNGAEIIVDKNGGIALVPKAGQEVDLGGLVGDGDLKKLVNEEFQDMFNNHGHVVTETGVPGAYRTTKPVTEGAPVIVSVPPTTAISLGSSELTTITKAK